MRKVLTRNSLGSTVQWVGALSAAYKRAETDRAALADAVEQASDAIVITDAQGRIQYVNPAFNTLTGYSVGEALGRNTHILQSGRQGPSFYKEMWDTILAGNIWHGELVNRRKDGTLYTEEMTITPVRGRGGAISRFIAIKKDTTTRQEAAEAQALLASIVESSEDAIFSTSLDGRILSWNRGAQALYGYSAEEIIGRPLSTLVYSDHQDDLRQRRQALSCGENQVPFDGIGIRKDGKAIDISVRPFLVRNRAGEVVREAAIVRDISLRKETEQARALLASIVTSSREAIFSTSLDGTFLTWNQGAEATWGYKAEEVIGKHVAMLTRPHLHPQQAEVLERIRKGESSQLDTVTLKADGTPLEVAVTVSPVLNAAGEVVGSSTIARDISDRTRAEEALRQSERKYRSLVAHIPDVIWTANGWGEPVFVSDGCEKMSGYRPEEICGGGWRAMIHPEDLPRLEESIQRMRTAWAGPLTEGETYDEECRIRRKDGEWIWIHARATGSYEKDGRRYVDGLLSDITERKRLEQDLAFRATHDYLTGLPNRQRFEEVFQQALSTAARQNGKLALLYLDFDGFKVINDSLGHQAGDDLLRHAAQRLKGCLRESEMLARVGGDEFMLMLPNADDLNIAPGIAERMLGALSAPFRIGSQEIFLSASIGIASYPLDGQDLLALQRNADAAMFTAKRRGKNRVQAFMPAMGDAASRRLAVETELHHALERHEFSLVFQPEADLATGAMTGLEALLRWNNSKLGRVAPSEFIPIAEDTGLILPISDWVLREVCRQQQAWRASGYRPLPVALNISAAQFSLGNLPHTIARALEESAIDPLFLDLELTESAVMYDVNESARQLAELKKLGVSISLDDFGTGYCSLNYLMRFPIDHLKIDQSFVQRMDSGPDAIALVHAIVSLAHSLRIKTIAEGVECERSLELLKAMGCDMAQGYLLGKPMHPALVFEIAGREYAARTLAGGLDRQGWRSDTPLVN